MKKSEIEKDNKLIAEYMGYEKIRIGFNGTSSETVWQKKNEEWMDENGMNDVGDYIANIKENDWKYWEDVEYHSSWDQLMPVLEKIARDYDITIRWFDEDCSATIYNRSFEHSEVSDYGNYEPAITNVWLAAVDLIKSDQKIEAKKKIAKDC